jgi:hypothetical protein
VSDGASSYSALRHTSPPELTTVEEIQGKFPLGVAAAPARASSDGLAAWLARHAGDAAGAFAAMALSLVAAGLVLKIWHGNLHVPFAYSWDALFVEMITKNLEHGWYFTNANLGAPFGQQLYDFPIGNALNLAVLKVLVLATGNPIVALNVFFLIMFPLSALTAYLVMRSVRVSPAIAAACSALFALLPYHFSRGEANAFLSAYYAIPLIAYLVFGIWGSVKLFRERGLRPRPLRFATARTLLTLMICVIIGAGSPYYAAGAIVLIGVAAVVAALAHHRWRPIGAGALLVAVLAGTLAASAAPALVYRSQHGTNDLAAKRSAYETELYSLKITDLVLPLSDHRLKPLAHVTQHYDSTSPVTSEGGQTLGFIGSFGLLALLVGGFTRVVRGGSWRIGGGPFFQASAATVIVLLFATTAGFASVVSYTISPQLHAWNRLSILVGFFSLLAVAFLIEGLWRRWCSSPLRFLFPFVLLAVMALGVLDQTSNALIPPYKQLKVSYESDAHFVRAIESLLPRGAAVYQLPYVAFPESGTPGAFDDYAQLKGYLHSDTLRWSYGAMKGRPSDWAGALATLSLQFGLPAVAASGFDGVFVDRDGYADGGRPLQAELTRLLHEQPLRSRDGHLLFFDLRSYAESLRRSYAPGQLAALRTAALHPLKIRWSSDFWPIERQGERSWRWTKSGDAYFELINPAPKARQVTLRFTLAARLSGASNAIVFYPNGSSLLVPVTPTGVPVEQTFSVPPGRQVVRLSSDAPKIATVAGDPRSALYMRVGEVSLTDAAFLMLSSPSGPGRARHPALG